MAKLDLSNWTQDSTNDAVYNRESKLAVGSDLKNNALRRAGSSRIVKQSIRTEVNIETGDYTVYATGIKELGLKKPKGQKGKYKEGKDIPIYSYNATKQPTYKIKDINYYDRIFGSMVNSMGSAAKKNEKFNTDIRLDLYNIASLNTDTKAGRKSFKELGKLDGYKSAKNMKVSDEPTAAVSVSPPKKKGIPNQPNDLVVMPPPATRVDGISFTKDTSTESSSTTSPTRSTPNKDLNTDSNSTSTNVTVSKETKSTSSSGNDVDRIDTYETQYMRYPIGYIPDLGYDYIQITSYKYEAVGLPTSYSSTGEGRGREDLLFEDALNIIQLPMVSGITETSAVTWADDTVDEIKNIAAGIAFNAIDKSGDPFSAVGTAFKDLIVSGQTALGDVKIQRAIAAYFAGQAAGVPNILQRATGQMINNNLELLFNGPNLRSFNFAFQFRPRSKEEAKVIRNIIRALKTDSAPKRSEDYMFLETPNIFKIEYIYNESITDSASAGTLHPYMNRIKPCALTGMSVNYTPDGSYMTYEDGGSMTGYDVSLSFKEIEPIYRDDQEGSPAESMGY